MSNTAWKVISAVEVVALAALTIWAAVSGGCTTQVELASGAGMPMKCFWTFKAVPVVGAVGVVSALLALFAKTREGRRFCSVVTACAAIAAMLVPTSLVIGLCANPEMHCHTTALGVWVIGAIGVVVAIVQVAKADPDAAERPKMAL